MLAILMRAMCENPNDDLPRLAYADCCEENGHLAIATFVREQVATGSSSSSTNPHLPMFSRGFPNHLCCTLDEFMRLLFYFELFPITSARLTDKRPWPVKSPLWANRKGHTRSASCPMSYFHF